MYTDVCFCVAAQVSDLFNMAGQVGKAMGTLVTVMTDDEGSGDDDNDFRYKPKLSSKKRQS